VAASCKFLILAVWSLILITTVLAIKM